MNFSSTTLSHRIVEGYNKQGVCIFAKNHDWGSLIVRGSMFNRQYRDSSISKLLQLVVNIV